MATFILKLSSVTYALRAQKLLERHSIRSTIRKSTQNLGGTGCGYGVEVAADPHIAAQILNDAGIRILDVFPSGF